MTFISMIELKNYRRFRGEIAFPLKDGNNLITGPNGSGKSTILEAIAFCILGDIAVRPDDILSVDDQDRQSTDLMVALTFDIGASSVRLERTFHVIDSEIERSWSVRKGPTTLSGNGWHGMVPFMSEVGAMFPPDCVRSNLIQAASLQNILSGNGNGSIEMSIKEMGGTMDPKDAICSAMDAMDILSAIDGDSPIELLTFDVKGGLMIRPRSDHSSKKLDHSDLQLISAAAALGYARMTMRPILLDDTFKDLDPASREALIRYVADRSHPRQMIFMFDSEVDADCP